MPSPIAHITPARQVDVGASRLLQLAATKAHTASESVLRAHWLGVDRLKTVSLRPLQRAVRSIFERQEEAVLRELRGRSKAIKQDGTLLDFEISLWDEVIQRELPPHWLAALRDGFETGIDRVAVEGISFTVENPLARSVLRDVLSKTKGINETTLEVLEGIIERGLVEEATWEEITGRIVERFDEWKVSRAELVARTSGTPTFEAGQQIAFESAGVGRKRWLSRRDGNVRTGAFDHLRPDGQEVSVGESFIISGEALRFPADPSGSPGNVISCRCTSLAIIT